ncbi:sulfotransferase [Gloeothece citriformis PCC 7424]|uniref:Sulfotransferase n=1 Tax=Gloeothece citriformis (strain PCC 7424) TaxID=65393 RepID=B7KLK1_GLOC7|nr:sulfotransferase [Gloeothece citriformis]ACK72573.1 sulfotransferase [Gloeothece citriformis PCC 7424]
MMKTNSIQLNQVLYKAKELFFDDNQRRYLGLSGVLPDFLIVGAQKAGTTSLYYYLKQHPQIMGASQNEVHFFDYKFHKGLLLYKSYFPTQREIYQKQEKLEKKVLTGETSPYYLFHPLVPKRIATLLPEVKIIIILRNPVARTYSHYQHEVRKGRETLTFEEALKQEKNRLKGEVDKIMSKENYYSYNHACFAYIERSKYIEQIKKYCELLKQENLLILSSEEFFYNPQEVYNEVLKFLGLDSFSIMDKNPKNVGSYNKTAIPLENKLREYYQPYNQQLYDYLQKDFGWSSNG